MQSTKKPLSTPQTGSNCKTILGREFVEGGGKEESSLAYISIKLPNFFF